MQASPEISQRISRNGSSPVPLRVLLADHEPSGRDRLRRALQLEPGVSIIAECASGTETLRRIREDPPDAVFLEIAMPDLDGFGVLDALKPGLVPVVIFITHRDESALRAFAAGAADYLLKPFDQARLQKSLERTRAIVERDRDHRAVRDMRGLLTSLASDPKPADRLSVKSGRKVAFLDIHDIDWVRGAGNYTELHIGPKQHLLRQSLTALSQRLPPRRFLRVSRSLIVNLERIAELRPKSHGDSLLILRDGTRLTVSRSYRKKVQQHLHD